MILEWRIICSINICYDQIYQTYHKNSSVRNFDPRIKIRGSVKMQLSTPSSQIISYYFSILTRTSKLKCIAIFPLRESSSVWITSIWLHGRAINLVRFKREHLPRLLCSIFIISSYCWSHCFDLTLLFILFLTFFQLLTLLLSHLAIW